MRTAACCVACFSMTACSANCIYIVAEESPWPDQEKYPKQFDIDERLHLLRHVRGSLFVRHRAHALL